MKHVSILETRSAIPLETRDDGGDPIAEATRVVNELRTAWTEFRGDTADVSVRALLDRIDAIETRAARPGTGTTTAADTECETRAIATFARTGDDTELRAASSDHDPSGGYFVMPTVESTIRTILRDRSPMREMASGVTIGTDAYEIPIDADEAEAEWVTERGVRPQDTGRPELTKVRIPVGELYAAPKVTQRLLDDSSYDIAAWLLNSVSDKFSRAEASAFITGNGANDRPRGILDYSMEAADDFARSKWDVWQYVKSGAATGIVADSLIDIAYKLRGPYRPNASWLMNRSTASRVRKLKSGDGSYLWSDTGGLVDGEPITLLGFPVRFAEDMPNVAAGAVPIAFGDFRQGYCIVDRHGVRMSRDTISAKPYVIMDSFMRVGGGGVDFNAIKFCKVEE